MVYVIFALLVIVPLLAQLAICRRAKRRFYRHSLWLLALVPAGYAVNEYFNGADILSGVTMLIYLAIAAEMLIGYVMAWLIYFIMKKLEPADGTVPDEK